MVSEDDVDAGLVDQFCAITEASADTAKTFVSAANGDLNNAIAMFFAGARSLPTQCDEPPPSCSLA